MSGRFLEGHKIDYFLVKVPKFARFYLLSKIHKQLKKSLQQKPGKSKKKKKKNLKNQGKPGKFTETLNFSSVG